MKSIFGPEMVSRGQRIDQLKTYFQHSGSFELIDWVGIRFNVSQFDEIQDFILTTFKVNFLSHL